MKNNSYKLGFLCEITSSKRIFYKEYQTFGVPFYRSKEIIELYNHANIDTELFISKERYDEIKSKFGVPVKEDILLTSVGTIGIPYLVKQSDRFYFKDGNLTWFRKYKRNLVDPSYLFLWIKSNPGRQILKILSLGAAQPALTISKLKNISISLPPLASQQRIAGILSAYDDLIENNNKRIRLLEQMAENLYKEWFVRFRFPGHEHTPMHNGIPSGWKRVNLFDLAEVVYGYAFKSNRFCNDSSLTPVVRIRDILDNHTETFTDETCEDKYLIKKNAILVGMDGIFHMCLWNGERAFLNQRVVMLNSKEDTISNYFLFLAIRPQIKYWEQVISGTTVAHLGDKHLKKIKVLIPSKELLNKANKIITEAMDESNLLLNKNRLLAKQRDLLLPRLMIGKLEVDSRIKESPKT